MRVAFHTLGCKVNTYESEALQKLFGAAHFKVVPFEQFSDVYVINTCTVTNKSDAKSRNMIRRAVKRNPEAVVAVIGCYSQIDPARVASMDGVDIIMGTHQRAKLLEHVQTVLKTRKQITDVHDLSMTRTFDELGVEQFTSQTRAFIKIQDGCNQYCSFCIIPFARGHIKSRPLPVCVDEAKAMVEKGYQEIVLTGIHTGGYGQDLNDTSLYDLLDALRQIDGLKRIRISSIEINQLSDEIIDLIAHNKIFARHLHIPIQSGDDTILKAMRRRYDVKTFLKRLNVVKSRLQDIAITTDVIVGFPGETDEQFENTVNTLKAAAFSELHVFPYSKRGGTKAAAMTNHIDGITKQARVASLLALNEQLAINYRDKLRNKPLEVLYESCKDGLCTGHTSEYIRVAVKDDAAQENTIAKVHLSTVDYPESKATRLIQS